MKLRQTQNAQNGVPKARRHSPPGLARLSKSSALVQPLFPLPVCFSGHDRVVVIATGHPGALQLHMSTPETKQTLITIRHALRIDEVDGGQWAFSAERPWDPPLSTEGCEQVRGSLGQLTTRPSLCLTATHRSRCRRLKRSPSACHRSRSIISCARLSFGVYRQRQRSSTVSPNPSLPLR